MIKLKLLLNEQTYEVYRGDDEPFTKFDSKMIGSGVSSGKATGFWFTDSADAAGYYGQHVRKFRINMNNPLVVSSEEFRRNFPNGPTWFAKKSKAE